MQWLVETVELFSTLIVVRRRRLRDLHVVLPFSDRSADDVQTKVELLVRKRGCTGCGCKGERISSRTCEYIHKHTDKDRHRETQIHKCLWPQNIMKIKLCLSLDLYTQMNATTFESLSTRVAPSSLCTSSSLHIDKPRLRHHMSCATAILYLTRHLLFAFIVNSVKLHTLPTPTYFTRFYFSYSSTASVITTYPNRPTSSFFIFTQSFYTASTSPSPSF